MADEVLRLDGNYKPVVGAVTNDVTKSIRMLLVDPTTGELLVKANVTLTGAKIEAGNLEVQLEAQPDDPGEKADSVVIVGTVDGTIPGITGTGALRFALRVLADGRANIVLSDGTTVGNLLAVDATGRVTVNQGGSAVLANAWLIRITDGTNIATVTAGLALKVDGSAVTQPISGTVTANANQGTAGGIAGAWPVKITDGIAVAGIGGVGPSLKVTIGDVGVTQPVSGTVTANIGTTGGLALDATLTARLPAALTAGGGVKVGLVDALPTGTNTIGVVTGAAGAALGLDATLLGIKTGTDKIPASPAQEHTAAASPNHAVRLTDGTAFYKGTTPADTQPISAASLPLPAGAATEASLAAIKDTAGIKKITDALPTGANTIGAVTGPGAAALALDATVVPRGTTPDVKGHVTSATVNTETSFTLPVNVKQVFLKARSANTVNVAFATGKVPPAAGNDYFTISDTKTFNLDKVQIGAGTLFFSSAVASVVVEIVTVV